MRENKRRVRVEEEGERVEEEEGRVEAGRRKSGEGKEE